MTEPIDAVTVLLDAFGYDPNPGVILRMRDALSDIRRAAGLSGDGRVVLRYEEDRVVVEGVAEYAPGAADRDSAGPLYRIVETEA